MDTVEVQPARPSPLEHRTSAADRVYQYAKNAILERRFGPHEFVTEGELADAVGVSRTPVREALLRLQAEGLLQLMPKRGALVLPVTPAEVADVLETRRLVETFAIRKAIGTRGLADRLAGHVAAMRSAARIPDARAFIEADRDFHEEIVGATGNEIIVDLYRGLRDRQLRMGVVNLLEPGTSALDRAAQTRMRANIADHEAILAAVAGRTLRGAEAAVAAHLDHAQHHLGRR